MKQVETPRVDFFRGIRNAFGESALSNRTLLLFLIPSSMVILIGNVSRIEEHVVEWSIVNLFAYLVPVVVILILRPLLSKINLPVPYLVLAILLLAGVARGSIVYYFGITFEVVPDWGLGRRLFGALTLVVGSFASLGLYEGSRLRHLQSISFLQQKQLEVTELRGSLKERIRQQRQALLAQVKGVISPVINQLSADMKTAPSAVLVKSFQNSVENVVRPLSHTIASSEDETLELSSRIQKATSARPITSVPKRVMVGQMFIPSLLLASMVSFLVTATEIYYPTNPVMAGLLLLVWLYLGAGLSKQLLQNVSFPTWGAFIYVNLLMVAIAFMSFISLKLFDFYVDVVMFLQYTSALLIISYLIFALQLARTQRAISEMETEVLLDELQRLNSKLKQEAWLSRHTIATKLHGSVQSAFYSAAMKLSSSPDPSPEVIKGIESDMDRALQQVFEGANRTEFDKDFHELVQLWDSVATIRLEIDSKTESLLRENSILASCAMEIIREGVSNAIRHAQAKNITISILQASDEFLSLRVVNDGKALSEDSKAGFGSELLDQLAASWSISSNGETKLVAEIAI